MKFKYVGRVLEQDSLTPAPLNGIYKVLIYYWLQKFQYLAHYASVRCPEEK